MQFNTSKILGLIFINIVIFIYLYREIAICQQYTEEVRGRERPNRKEGNDQHAEPSIFITQMMHLTGIIIIIFVAIETYCIIQNRFSKNQGIQIDICAQFLQITKVKFQVGNEINQMAYIYYTYNTQNYHKGKQKTNSDRKQETTSHKPLMGFIT